jgi:hypothetical protein
MPQTLRESLIGAWTLEAYVERPVDGSSDRHPLGEDATGLILYTPDGFMSAQLMRQGRRPFASGYWFDGTAEEYRDAASYIAYSGPFDIDEQARTLTHTMYVSFYPNWLSQAQPRAVELDGDILRLSSMRPIRSGGVLVLSHLQWRRARLGAFAGAP